MSTIQRSVSQIDALLRGAKQLGFADDVAHWTAERAKAVKATEEAAARSAAQRSREQST